MDSQKSNIMQRIGQLIANNRGKLVVLAAVVVIGFFLYRHFFGTSQTVAPYQTTAAQKGTLIQTVSASGTITSGNSINITTQATGLVDHVYVKNGATVSKGQKIADLTLDLDSQQRYASTNSTYQAAVNSVNVAEENRLSADATLWKDRQTVLDDQNTEDLKNQGINNPSTKLTYTNLEQQVVDSALIQANKQFNVDQQKVYDADQAIIDAKAQEASVALQVAQSSPMVSAPMSGVITNLTLVPGLAIAANSSATNSSSATVASQSFGSVSLPDSHVQATVNLSEIDAVMVQVGQKVTMTLDAFPNKTFTASVLSVNTDGVITSGVTNYPTTLEFDTADAHIYPNMAVTAKIITNTEDNVLLVPSSAVQTISGQSSVRVLKNGKPTTVAVEVGDSNDTQTIITNGLSEGDQVITGGGPTTGTSAGTTGTSPFGALGGGRGGFGGGAIIRGGGGGRGG